MLGSYPEHSDLEVGEASARSRTGLLVPRPGPVEVSLRWPMEADAQVWGRGGGGNMDGLGGWRAGPWASWPRRVMGLV